VDPPVCPHCKEPGIYRPAKGNRAAFYGCKNWEAHAKAKLKAFTVDAGEWIKEQAKKAPAAAPGPAAAPEPTKVDRELKADDIDFSGGRATREREPGEEG
jgi:hypothetical protein